MRVDSSRDRHQSRVQSNGHTALREWHTALRECPSLSLSSSSMLPPMLWGLGARPSVARHDARKRRPWWRSGGRHASRQGRPDGTWGRTVSTAIASGRPVWARRRPACGRDPARRHRHRRRVPPQCPAIGGHPDRTRNRSDVDGVAPVFLFGEGCIRSPSGVPLTEPGSRMRLRSRLRTVPVQASLAASHCVAALAIPLRKSPPCSCGRRSPGLWMTIRRCLALP